VSCARVFIPWPSLYRALTHLVKVELISSKEFSGERFGPEPTYSYSVLPSGLDALRLAQEFHINRADLMEMAINSSEPEEFQ
jgi:hypothetical protein